MWLLWFVLIGGVAGWLAGRFMRGNGFGLIGDGLVGIAGAFVGGYVFRAQGVNAGGGSIGSLAGAFVGATVLLFVVRLFHLPPRRPKGVVMSILKLLSGARFQVNPREA